VYPDAAVRDDFPDADYASLIDTSKTASLFEWTPRWRWREQT